MRRNYSSFSFIGIIIDFCLRIVTGTTPLKRFWVEKWLCFASGMFVTFLECDIIKVILASVKLKHWGPL